MGYCLKYLSDTVSLRVVKKNAYEFNKILFRIIINSKEAHPCTDNVSISLRYCRILFYVTGVLKRKN